MKINKDTKLSDLDLKTDDFSVFICGSCKTFCVDMDANLNPCCKERAERLNKWLSLREEI